MAGFTNTLNTRCSRRDGIGGFTPKATNSSLSSLSKYGLAYRCRTYDSVAAFTRIQELIKSSLLYHLRLVHGGKNIHTLLTNYHRQEHIFSSWLKWYVTCISVLRWLTKMRAIGFAFNPAEIGVFRRWTSSRGF